MKQILIKFILFFLFSISPVVAADITNTNVWSTTAAEGDRIFNTAWNEVCGASKPSNGTLTAAEWTACNGTADNDGIIRATEWNSLVNKKRVYTYTTKAKLKTDLTNMASNGQLNLLNGYKIRKDTCASDNKCILFIPSSNILVSSGDKQTSGTMPNSSTCSDNGGACSTCYDMENGGLGGNNSGFWKLPPRDTGGLSDLYTNRAKLNNLSSTHYWSSLFSFNFDRDAVWRNRNPSANSVDHEFRWIAKTIRCTASL